MKTTSKLRPGLAVSSKEIRSRLKNRTLQPMSYSNEDYIQNEELIKIQKMNKVEREMHSRQINAEIKNLTDSLDKQKSAKKAKQDEEKINRMAEERFKTMRDEMVQKEKV